VNGHTEIPTVHISPEATYSMLHQILTGWTCRIWLTSTPVILVAEWMGEGDSGDQVFLKVWDTESQDYRNRIHIPIDDVRRVEIM
jgi:hypothetical protein